MPARPASSPRPSRFTFPQRIETPRLVLRPHRHTDAPLVKAAVDGNLDHLRAWMPWAKREPSTLIEVERRIEKFDLAFRSESAWGYLVFSEGEKMLYGSAGVHRSEERGTLEIGFWLQKAWTGNGYATEAVKALAEAALGMPGIERVQIRCDARNTASAAVARRAGFSLVATLSNHVFEQGEPPRDTMVWELSTVVAGPEPAPQARGFWARLISFFRGGR